jgi:hypothetical protein
MKFTKRNDRVSRDGNRPGFEHSHIIFLSHETRTPHTQIFSSEEIIEDPSKEEYFCAMCRGILDYNKYSVAYECKACVQWRCHCIPCSGEGKKAIRDRSGQILNTLILLTIVVKSLVIHS